MTGEGLNTIADRTSAVRALAMGSLAMMVTGLQPLLLSELADAGRLSPALVHPAAIVDMLCMAASVAGCALLVPPTALRRWAGAAATGCILVGLGALIAHDGQFLVLRALGGLCGGVLIWITVGMIARQPRPEPWAAAFFLAQSAGQVILAGVAVSLLAPRFGPAGGVLLAAGLSGLALVCALLGPTALPDLRRPQGGRRPGRRGLLALAALFLYFAGNAALWFHMRPLAEAEGLGQISGTIVVVTLAAQMVGAMAALALAERISRRALFGLVVGLALLAAALLATHPPAALFIAAFGLAAFAALLLGASLFGILNAADPGRRAGAISPTAQFCAAALGPLAGMAAAAGAGPFAALAVAAACALASLALAWISLPKGGSASRDCA
ncbi:MAG: hypothetical protein GC145_17625 [Caulobacter sp.]|nr:hypothetical protein [Caulobacter sp.]